MKGKLFLSGGGSEVDTYDADRSYLSWMAATGKPILYVPLALDWKDYTSARQWFRKMLTLHEANVEFETIGTVDALMSAIPESFGSVYLGGGNTYVLLDLLRKTGFGKRLIRYVDTGGVVYGGSAGAIVLGEDIDIVSEECFEGFLGESNGMNLLGACLRCHVTTSEHVMLRRYAVDKQRTALGLPETVVLEIYDGHFRVTGRGAAWVFRPSGEKLEFAAGCTASLSYLSLNSPPIFNT